MPGDSRFARFFAADALSMLGDWFTYVGIGVIAVGQAHGELALVVVLVAHTVPRALLAPAAGALADRVDRRALLVGGSLARGAIALAMAAAAMRGAWWTVQGLHLVRMGLGAIPDAAARAALPRLVPASRLGRANAQLGVAWSVAFAVGVAGGGVTVAAGGAALAFAIDAASFAIAALGFAGLPAMAPARAQPVRGAPRVALAKVPSAIATGAAWIAVQTHAGEAAAGAALAIGAIHAARAIGAGVTPLVWPARWRDRRLDLHVANAIAIAGAAAAAYVRAPGLALAAACVWGAGVAACWITATTRLQARSPDPQLGRTAALDLQAQALAQCAGGVIAAALGGEVGVALALVAWAVLA